MTFHALLLTATLPVALLLVMALIQKGGFRRAEHTVLILFLTAYSLALFDKVREEAGLFDSERWEALYLTSWFAFGPLIYLYFRATLLPAKKSLPYPLGYLLFAPALVELLHALAVWVADRALAPHHPIQHRLAQWQEHFNTLSFYYLIGFVALSVVFLIRQRALRKYQVLYHHKLRWLQYFAGFMVVIIIAELASSESDVPLLYYPVCAFIYLLAFRMMVEPTLFSGDDALAKEWLKKALQEKDRATIVTNASQKVVYVNAAFLSVSKRTRKEVMNQALMPLLQTDTDTTQRIREDLKSIVPTDVSLVSHRKNGEAFMAMLSIFPVREQQQVTFLIAYLKDRGAVAPPTPDETERERLEQVRQLLQTPAWYGNAQLQQAQVATALNISSRVLGVLLNKYTGQTFPQLLNDTRVEVAQQMLVDTSLDHLSVMEVATQVGFSSKTAFYTAFKKKVEMTPAAFREQQC